MAKQRSPRPVLSPEMAVALLDELFSQRTAALAVLDTDMRYVAVNERLAEMNGRPAAEHPGRTIREVVPEPAAAALERIAALTFTGESVGDVDVDAGDGTGRRFRLSAHPVRDPDGTVIASCSIVVEVTGEREARVALQLTRQRLQLALEGTLTGTFEWDADADPIGWSDTMGTLWGRGRGWAPATYAEFENTVHPGDREELAHVVRTALARHEGYDYERWPADPDAPTGVPGVIRTGRSELYPEIPAGLLEESARDAEHARTLRELALHSAMIVPMTARGRTTGAISFVFAESGREYTTEQLALAEELGRRARLAVDNARLHAAERRANERLRELHAVTDLGLAHLSVDDLLPELLCRVRDLTGSDIAVVLLGDEETGDLHTRAAIGLDIEAIQGTRVPMGQGVAGRIAATRRPLIVPDVRAAEPVWQHLRERARSLVGVPLLDGDRVLGVLHVSTTEPRTFGAADVELLQLVAERAARAIAHARVYEQANQAAVTLQRSLLSHALPAIEDVDVAVRYVPGQAGTEVGGDWYDAFPLGDGCWGVVVGDVVGRGLTAAATMGRLRASLRAYALDTRDPAEAVTKLDRLALALDQVPLATLAMLAIGPADGRGSICVAGHPLPVLRTPGGDAELLEVPSGPPLALVGPGRRAHPLALERGATLLLYTDGLVERRSASLDGRLAELRRAVAEAPANVEGLLDHVLERMLGAAPSRDDAALVAIRRREEP